MKSKSIWNKYSYLWVTAILFIGSIIGHWIFAWHAYVDDQKSHDQPIEAREYVTITMRDTFENWQSEFLQLIWQVGGLAFLFSVGSPSSKEGDERKEEKIDQILLTLNQENGEKIIKNLNSKYPKR